MTEEQKRLDEARSGAPWRLWGPYLAERAWGTVREDYGADGDAWNYLPHDHARSRAYRWNEDGLLGICDDGQRLCFALSLWNGADPFLKERFFGLTGPEGNHGEDAKEYWFFLDNLPTHSYMRALYKYPHRRFPYERLLDESRRRTRDDPEFELLDTGVFDEDRYWDVQVEYAKSAVDDVLCRVTLANRGPDAAELHLLPTLWFRNNWSWAHHGAHPSLSMVPEGDPSGCLQVLADHHGLGRYHWTCEGGPEMLFTGNESNTERLFGSPNATPYVKDAFHRRVVDGVADAVNPAQTGTKAAAWYRLAVPPGGERVVRMRLSAHMYAPPSNAWDDFDAVFAARLAEADAFHATLLAPEASADERLVQRQAVAGLLWSKQFYHYDVHRWLGGDAGQPPPPAERWSGRNHAWLHLNNHDVISMPDTWEYPWYASWDLAFHCIPLALVDADFAKEQLVLLLREWYMHPNGQLPAYEWSFGDVNPPVHAWAALRVYQVDRRLRGGTGDLHFLERVFHKLLINFTWWVNRKDAEGRNVFQGGFLGLDNIGLFNRSEPLPGGGYLDQSDGTSWMAMYCLNMLAIALELATNDDCYEDVATKFLEHFFHIAHAINDRPATMGDEGVDLWDNEDEFYYDLLHLGGEQQYLRVRSMVGMIPLLAVQPIEAEVLDRLPGFRARLEWFLANRPDLVGDAAAITRTGEMDRRLFAVVSEGRLRAILRRMLDETEFLSPYGLRSVSRWHAGHPYRLELGGQAYEVGYEPAESRSGLFGGNSNWRGPVWFPINFLIIEALQKFDWYYGPSFTVECPAGSGRMLTLWEVSVELSRRLIALFIRHGERRPVFGGTARFQDDPLWRDLISFHEYFHGDNGAGLGASHQTGWTALVAKLIQQSGVPSVT
jgi:hypothetical protein